MFKIIDNDTSLNSQTEKVSEQLNNLIKYYELALYNDYKHNKINNEELIYKLKLLDDDTKIFKNILFRLYWIKSYDSGFISRLRKDNLDLILYPAITQDRKR